MSTLFWQRGWLPARSGNFSLRNKKGAFVSQTQRDKSRLLPDHFTPICTTTGAYPLNRYSAPSGEWFIHAAILAHIHHANIVLHVHSPFICKASKQQQIQFQNNEILKNFNLNPHDRLTLQVIDNPLSQEELHHNSQFLPSLKTAAHSIIFANHGIYSWGTSVEQIATHIESLEFLCQLQFQSQ